MAIWKLGQEAEKKILDQARRSLKGLPADLSCRMPMSFEPVGPDAIVAILANGAEVEYACEIKSTATPKAIELAIAQVLRLSAATGKSPLILVPYLPEEALQMLSQQKISGIDLCGNACIMSDRFFIWRSGQPNRNRAPSPHLNPFRGDNSIFSRCFLMQSEFQSLQALQNFAAARTLPPRISDTQKILTMGTASKTVTALQEQLIVTKVEGAISLLDRQKLMIQLKRNYQPPIARAITGKTPFSQEEAWERLRELKGDLTDFRYSATGLFSAVRCKVLSPSRRLSAYVDRFDEAVEALELQEGAAFANCELIETSKNFPYFDLKDEDGAIWAPPIQTWLELATGSARGQEAAQSLERSILERELL